MDSVKITLKQHQSLVEDGSWAKMSFAEQMGNIGSEVSRSLKWYKRKPERFEGAFEHALELFDWTIFYLRGEDSAALEEICLAREEFCDYFYGHELHTDPAKMQKYYDDFAMKARKMS